MVILKLVNVAQTGFIPDRCAQMNIRRLSGVAFRFLESYEFGPVFTSCVKLLYIEPLVRLRVNCIISEPFPIFRGTRQGCPLSPLLFALAIEPLATKLRSRDTFSGLRLGQLEERVSLYTHDMLLYLQDLGRSLSVAFGLIQEFGDFSGFRINWAKSSLFPIDEHVVATTDCLIPLSGSFKYLGI